MQTDFQRIKQTSSSAPQRNKRINVIESNQSKHKKAKIPLIIKKFNEQPTQQRQIIMSLSNNKANFTTKLNAIK